MHRDLRHMKRRDFFLSLVGLCLAVTSSQSQTRLKLQLIRRGADFEKCEFKFLAPELADKSGLVFNSKVQVNGYTWLFMGGEVAFNSDGEAYFRGNELGACISGLMWLNPPLEPNSAVKFSVALFEQTERLATCTLQF